MAIHIPPLEELSDEQNEILFEMDLKENLLVVGPPGTGKTVMAMLRAKMVVKGDNETATLIMYNKVLVAYSNSYDEGEFQKKVDVRTYHSWGSKIWKQVTGEWKPPTIEGLSDFDYDWHQMAPRLRQAGVGVGHLLIDEGQDQPPDFYAALGILTTMDDSSVCVVADENQRLKERENSSIGDIRKKLGAISKPNEAKLTRNYRNSRPIAELARNFYVGLESGKADLPEGPGSEGSKPNLQKCDDLNHMIERISTYAINNPRHSILVIGGSVKKYFNRIRKRLPDRQVEGYFGSKYLHCPKCQGKGVVEGGTRSGRSSKGNKCPRCKSGEDMLHTADSGVITCVHYRSMKGLESDAVFIPNFEEHALGGDGTDKEKMKFYVMFTRARQYLEMQFDRSSDVDKSTMLQLMKKSEVKDKLAATGDSPGTRRNPDRPAPDLAKAVEQATLKIKKIKGLFDAFVNAAKIVPSFKNYKSREEMKNAINKYAELNPRHQILVVENVEFDGDFSSEKISCFRWADIAACGESSRPDAVFIATVAGSSADLDPFILMDPMNLRANPPDHFEVQILSS